MPARRKRGDAPNAWVAGAILVVAALVGVYLWMRAHHVALPAVVPVATDAPPSTPAVKQALRGRLVVDKPARDAELGISAAAVALLRDVSTYQWRETCVAEACSYALAWSSGHIDSSKFRTPAGHENSRAPFANARFNAGELHLAGVQIDPALLADRSPTPFAVEASNLPPNLAATFTVIDGVLYAGGDEAHPRAGTMRIAYRIVPGGDVEVSGVRHGNRLEPAATSP